MDLPAHTLKKQLDAAYLALETMARDRKKWRERVETEAAELHFRAAYETLMESFAALAVRADEGEQAAAAAQAQRQAAERLLEQMLGSRSWRVTRPLRRIAGVSPRAVLASMARRLAAAARFCAWTFPLRVLAAGVRRGVSPVAVACLRVLATAAAWWRLRFGRPRTMWGVTPILTLPLLARCDRLLGLRSESLVYTTYYITGAFDINLKRLWERVYARHRRWSGPLHKAILHLALIRYDTFHLFCDRGLMLPQGRMGIDELEMKAVRRLGRRLYTYAYGADVRTRETTLALGRYNFCIECPEPMKFCVCDESEGAANIARIRGLATAMVTMGDMQAYAPDARNFHYWPIDIQKVRYVGVDRPDGRALRVAHAPNHAHFKGTKYLVAAVERLRSEGRAIELVRVQGVPNSEVMTLFASCDVVADQFIDGFHGYTAVEAMALGKPVLCYLRDPSMAIDPANCPVINVWPDTVYDTLKDCLEGRHDLVTLGLRGRAYIEHYYSLEAVALRLGRLYLDTAKFGARIDRMISQRMEALERTLPPLIAAPPPIPWEAAARISTPQESIPSKALRVETLYSAPLSNS
jgi:hypothetical protein